MRGHGLVNRRDSPYTLTPVSALTALTHPERHIRLCWRLHGIVIAERSRSANTVSEIACCDQAG